MTLDDVKDIETLRRAAKILEAEVQTLSKLVLSLKRELHEAKHGKPEQLKLALQIQELEDQLARRNKLLFGDSSEKRGSAQPKMGPDAFEIVMPSVSILAEPPVALVDAVVDRKGTRGVAEAYLQYLYSPEGQDIVARNYFRPRDRGIAETYADRFPAIRMFTIDDVFGGWREAQTKHFNDGGIYDRIFSAEASSAPRR